MKAIVLVLLATAAAAQPVQVPVLRIADDAKVVDRVAQASKGDLPRDILRRIVYEDIELLRGHRNDGTYAYASYERMEASRVSESYSIQPSSDDRLTKVDIRGEFSYRLVIGLPQRRMMVTKNRPLWLENVEVEYIPQGSSTSKSVNFPIKATMEPGETRNVDLPDIGRSATAHVYVRAAKDAGYGNVVLTLIQARIFDNPDSPYADAINTAKAMIKALDHTDVPSLRSLASRLDGDLRPTSAAPAVASVPVTPAPSGTSIDVAAPTVQSDVYAELQSIEDLLTGTDAERRAGLDRLHQLLRRLRSK